MFGCMRYGGTFINNQKLRIDSSVFGADRFVIDAGIALLDRFC